jgi:colicin import membrane protein
MATLTEHEVQTDSADGLWESVDQKIEDKAPGRGLALLADLPAPELVFVAGGTDAIVQGIKAIAKEKAAGLSILNPKDRKELASIAHQIARSKTLLDDAGKNLKKERMRGIDVLDAERKRCRESLEEFQEEIRKPLTDFENANKARIKGHYDALAEIGAIHQADARDTVESLQEKILRIEEIRDRKWDEFAEAAKADCAAVETTLKSRLADAVKAREEAAELAKLRKEKAERDKAEREERIAREAAEKAQQEEAEKTGLEKAARIAAEERAKQAEIRAKQAAEQAVQNERKRAEEERFEIAQAAARKASNLKHREKIEAEVHSAMMDVLRSGKGCADMAEAGSKLLIAICNGEIPHVRIEY